FRNGVEIYSNKLGSYVRRHDVCAAPSFDLIDALMAAADFPRDKDGPMRKTVPQQFKNWAPIAWEELLKSLPDEVNAPELANQPRSGFARTSRSCFSPSNRSATSMRTAASDRRYSGGRCWHGVRCGRSPAIGRRHAAWRSGFASMTTDS